MQDMWPDDLFESAFLPDVNDRLAELAAEAEKEDREYHRAPSVYARPVLYNYIRQTYHRLAKEGKIALSRDGQFFASFEVNRQPGKQPWFFKGWFRKGRWE